MAFNPLLTGIIVVLLLASCDKTESEILCNVNQEDLSNSWIHDNAQCPLSMDFVPNNESFLSLYRLRNRLDLHADGSAHYTIGSPKDPHRNDAVTSVSGNWTFDPDTNTLMILNSSGEIVFAFKVRHLSNDLLRLRYTAIPIDPNFK